MKEPKELHGTTRFNALKQICEAGLLKPIQVTLFYKDKPLPGRDVTKVVTYYFEDLNCYYIDDGNGYSIYGKGCWSLNSKDMYKELLEEPK